MHARVTVLRGSAADIEAGVANFRENVAPFAKETGEGAMLLIDRDTGKAVAITLFFLGLWPRIRSPRDESRRRDPAR